MRSARSAPSPSSTSPAAAMVGRFTEASLTKSLLREAKGLSPSVLLVGGEDGVGKTRFVAEVASIARGMGFVVVTSRARRDDTNVLGALTQIVSGLADVLGEGAIRQAMVGLPASLGGFLPPLQPYRESRTDPGILPDPEGEKLRLYEATRLLLFRLCSRPTLWVCDDLHNARDGELKLFAFLARTLTTKDRSGKGPPLLAVATHRLPLEGGSLKKLILGAKEQGFPFESIRLAPLSEPDTFEMARSLCGSFPESLRKELFAKTGGNPFFIQEALKEASEGGKIRELPNLPAGVKGLVRARLQRFDEAARVVSCAAAALGDRFSLELLGAVVALPFGELLTTVAGLVEENILDRDHADRTFRFTHRFVKDAIYESSPAILRLKAHRAAAQVLEAEDDPGRYARLAYHYEQTGERERQIRNLLKAGLAALSRYDGREAGSTLERLLTVYEDLAPESQQSLRDTRIKALSGLVKAARTQGESDRAVKAARQFLSVARKEKDPGLIVGALRDLAEVLGDTQERSQALAYLDEAIRIARMAGDRVELAKTMSTKAILAQRLGDALTMPLLEEAIALADEVGDQELLAHALVRQALSIFKTGDDRRAGKLFDRALRIAKSQRLPRVTAAARMARGAFMAQKGDYEGGIRDFNAALAIHRRLGDLQGVGRGLVNLASLNAAMGNWERAIDLHKKAVALLKGMGLRAELATSLFTIGNIECDRRRYDRALDAYLEALQVFKETGDRHRIAECMNNIGITYFEKNDYQRARENLEASTSLCLELGYALCGTESNLYLGAVRVLAGDVEGGMKALEAALDDAEGHDFRHQVSVGQYLKGYVLAGQGKLDEGAAQVRLALEEAKRLGLLPAVERYKRTLAEIDAGRRAVR